MTRHVEVSGRRVAVRITPFDDFFVAWHPDSDLSHAGETEEEAVASLLETLTAHYSREARLLTPSHGTQAL